MNYDYTDDITYAADVCREYSPAQKQILHEYSDRLMIIASKFVNARERNDGWDYKMKKGYKQPIKE